MDEQLKSLLNWVFVWTGVIVLVTFLLNWTTHGFFIKYMRVKFSRGKKLLCRVRTPTDYYLTTGWITEGFLIYKKRGHKDNCRISINKGGIERSLGVFWATVDEQTDAILNADWEAVEGHDGERTENLYKRALMKPKGMDNKQKIIIILLIAVLLGLIIVGAMTYQNYRYVLGLTQI